MYMQIELGAGKNQAERSYTPPEGLSLRNLQPFDGDAFGELLFHSYKDTPDDEGESIESAILEGAAIVRGKYGNVNFECSLTIENDKHLVSAVMITDWKGSPAPLLAFSVTRREHWRMGYAENLLRASMDCLRKNGAMRLGLFVTKANVNAVNLYQKLGFQETAIPKK